MARKSKRDNGRGHPVMIGYFGAGAGIGALLYLAGMFMLQVSYGPSLPYIVVWALIGGLIHLTRFRGILWGAAGLFAFALTVCLYTPLIDGPAEKLIREDALHESDAIVTLSAGVTNSGHIGDFGLERMMSALKLADQGYAPVVVRTHLPESYANIDDDVEWLRSRLAPDASIEVIGPVGTTWDEAEEVRLLAEERGWERIILVTSPMHTSRAAAVFEASGVSVISHPCESRHYSREKPHTPKDRAYMLRRWLYEVAAWQWYKVRGRV